MWKISHLSSSAAVSSPLSLEDLYDRTKALEGRTIEDLALSLDLEIPNLQRAKGWVGQLIEHLLGANSGSKPQADFLELGIELKSIPVSAEGIPLASTFVCSAPYPFKEKTWEESRAAAKLRHVLWVPIYQEPKLIIGKAIFWKLDAETESILKKDWENLSEKLRLGQFNDLSAKLGEYLQLRPKAPNNQERIKVLTAELEEAWIVPKGFYLRRSFTTLLLKKLGPCR
jgi:DNA mismatch repair protein MutH